MSRPDGCLPTDGSFDWNVAVTNTQASSSYPQFMDGDLSKSSIPIDLNHLGDYQTQSATPPAPGSWCGFNVDAPSNTLVDRDCWGLIYGFRGTQPSVISQPLISRPGEQAPAAFGTDAGVDHWFTTANPDYVSLPCEAQIPHKSQLESARVQLFTGAPPSASHVVQRPNDNGPRKQRMDFDSSNMKPSGACTRCKRLKMKCSFPDSLATCARCLVGGHECVVLGRKPRSPGAGEILRKKIRQKDAEIDDVLNQLNPAPSLATPMSIVTSKLTLTESQRTTYKSALSWLEKPQNASKGQGDPRAKVDISTFDDSDMDSDGESSDDQIESPIEMGPLLGRFAPAGLLVRTAIESGTRCSADATSSTSNTGVEDSIDRSIEAGVGSKDYFQPGPATNLNLRRLIIERQAAPDILLSGLITFADAEKLFEIFFKWINPFIPVLDENIHTASAVLGRCPFLFTVVCALSSRYFTEKPELFGLAMHLAKAAAASNFLDGWKTLEMCQAYLLLGAYSPPARRWEEDRTWFYTGLAFRLAIELNLSRVPKERPTNERLQRELLNRLRTWVNCYVMDRIICTNLGKPFMIPEDELIQNAERDFLGFTHQRPGDTYLVCLVELLRIMTRFVEKIQPIFLSIERVLRSDLELLATHKVVTDDFMSWKNRAVTLCSNTDPSEDPGSIIQLTIMESVHQFCCLVTLSSGLQYITKHKLKDGGDFITGALNAANEVLRLMLDRLLPSGYLPYCPEQVFVFTAFAAASLMKLLRPEFSSKVTPAEREEAVGLLRRLRTSLDDERGGDVQEARQRYADFLRNILKLHLLDPNAAVSSRSTPQSDTPTPKAINGSQTSQGSPRSPMNGSPQHSFTDPNYLAFGGQWDPQYAPAYGTAPAFPGSDYLSSMMASGTQFWFQ